LIKPSGVTDLPRRPDIGNFRQPILLKGFILILLSIDKLNYAKLRQRANFDLEGKEKNCFDFHAKGFSINIYRWNRQSYQVQSRTQFFLSVKKSYNFRSVKYYFK